MGDVLEESLYNKQPGQFDIINVRAKSFSANYSGSTIIRDSIFSIIRNYARKKGLSLEILRYPFKDEELWAFTFAKKGIIFLCINSELAMCKQIFAAAHELYHIHCYAEDIESDTITRGSLLDAKTVDDTEASQEDLEANAFAGLLLMPDSLLDEQIKLYGITGNEISVDDVLTLIELFAVPYKAVVLRLFENNLITKAKARALFNIDKEFIVERIKLTGKSLGWQRNSKETFFFGSLLDDMEFNKENELLTETRAESDRKKKKKKSKLFLDEC